MIRPARGALRRAAGFWRQTAPTARGLMAVRFLRSVGQGAMAVDFVLFLHAHGWPVVDIGLLLMGGGLAGAVLSLLVGTLSDRTGRRGFLLFYEGGLALGIAALLAAPVPWLIVGLAVAFGFGRGANGASGPFAPAEQAWLARCIPAARRGVFFSINAALVFWGMGLGAAGAGILARGLPLPGLSSPYAALFVANGLIALINLGQIASLRERREGRGEREEGPPSLQRLQEDRRVRRGENRALALMVAVNAVNALGIGLIAPLLPYWFNVRFGVGPQDIGPVYAAAFTLTGAASLVVGRWSQRVGVVRAIVVPRLLGVAAFVALAVSPSFPLAAGFYLTRSVVNRGSVGVRQAFSMGLVRDRRRGLASSLNAVSMTVPAALGPAIGGWFLGRGELIWPFVLAALLQSSYLVLFTRVMGRYAATPGGE